MKARNKCRVEGCDISTYGIEGYCTKHREYSISRRYQRLKKYAKRKGIPVTLTLFQYEKKTELGACDYCGGPLPSNGYGLDRVDPLQGYSKQNSVPCCARCNTLKADRFTSEQTKIIVDFIALMEQNNWLKPEGEGENGNGI